MVLGTFTLSLNLRDTVVQSQSVLLLVLGCLILVLELMYAKSITSWCLSYTRGTSVYGSKGPVLFLSIPLSLCNVVCCIFKDENQILTTWFYLIMSFLTCAIVLQTRGQWISDYDSFFFPLKFILIFQLTSSLGPMLALA
ncbi:hypothetical protein ACH5RR_025813 [Cinchona calisaya]|uniref:Uncharacterized protein n=1 Tax=Cinchona calisaya TaxID=153742 RepID=A0ABD2Z0Q6_9GENT